MWLNKMVGEHRIIFVYSIIAIAYVPQLIPRISFIHFFFSLELTVWFVPSIVGNAVAV